MSVWLGWGMLNTFYEDKISPLEQSNLKSPTLWGQANNPHEENGHIEKGVRLKGFSWVKKGKNKNVVGLSKVG